MVRFKAEHHFELASEPLFDVLADVNSHREFIPFCRTSQVLATSPEAGSVHRMKAKYQFLQKKYGIDVDANFDVVADYQNYTISSKTVEENKSAFTSSTVTQLVPLADGGTKLIFDVSFQVKSFWGALMPKRVLLDFAFRNFMNILAARIRHVQQNSGALKSASPVPKLEDSEARSALLTKFPINSVGAELGVHMGAYAEEMLTVVKPQKLHLVDPWKALRGSTYEISWYAGKDQDYMDALHDLVCQRFETAISANTIEVHRCMSTDFLNSLENNTLDWVYIDADHSYEAVIQDLKDSFAKVKVNGLITGDDFKVAGWWQDAIVRAVKEFIDAYPVEHAFDIDGQFVLRKLADRQQ